ncbi:MAG TPA: twin-arginine translocation signal domain-containing protein [Chroococcidiopsis sp.]
MFLSKRWQSRAALLMTAGIASTAGLPLLWAQSAIAQPRPVQPVQPVQIAQLFSQPAQVRVAAGTPILVRYQNAEKIVVLPDETSPITLTVAEDVRSPRGTVVIPAGSQIEGELRPSDGGTQFVAETVIFPESDRRLPISATSNVITETETINRRSNPDFLKGAAIGAAAAAVLSEVLGDIDFIEVLAGAGLGALASVFLRGRREVEVVVVYPDTDLNLTLQDEFVLGQ